MSRRFLTFVLPTIFLFLLCFTPHFAQGKEKFSQPNTGIENRSIDIGNEQDISADPSDTVVAFELGLCYGEEPLVVNSANTTTTYKFQLTNNGLLPNDFEFAVVYFDGFDWASASPSSGTIPASGSVDITLTFEMPVGAAVPSTWLCTFVLTSSLSTDYTIPVCMTVGTVEMPEKAVIATACKRLAINNFGGAGVDSADASLDYIDDCDTFTFQTDPHTYLWMGVPLVGRVDGTDTLLFHGYDDDWLAADGYRPISPMIVDSTSEPGRTVVTSTFVTADSSVGCILNYYALSHPDSCEGILQCYRFFNYNGPTVNNVALGCFYDWDVPSDSSFRNTSGYLLYNNIIYQQGYEYDGISNGDCGQLEDDRFAGIRVISDFQNAMTLDDATWVYKTGPYGDDAPLPAGPVYQLMTQNEGYSLYNSSDPDSVAVDLSTLITFGVYNLSPGDTIYIWQVIGTGKTGLSNFIDDLNSLVPVWLIGCCNIAGDTNHDGRVNIGDCIYIIDHIFKGGDPPYCYDEADWNYDCGINIGDAVYCINHIFKGGPPSHCGCVH